MILYYNSLVNVVRICSFRCCGNDAEGRYVKPIELDAMPSLTVEFARHKKAVQGCSVKTVDEYMLDLRMFLRYIKLSRADFALTDENFELCDISDLTVSDFEKITTTEIYEFLYYLDTARGSASKNKARKLSAIKAFFKFLTVKKMLFEQNPAVNIETPKHKKELPKHLSVDESVLLLNTVQGDVTSKNRTRDFAILTLFLNCGMRLSELCGINLNDLDNRLRSVRVTGKGSKQRMIYLNDACRASLGDYLTLRQQTPANKGENALFISSRGTRISVKTVQAMVYRYLELAGLGNKGYSVHKLRHTAATLMYQTGEVDIRVLKDILGHEQLNTTQIYTHVSDKSMEAAMSKNPLASVNVSSKVNSAPEEE